MRVLLMIGIFCAAAFSGPPSPVRVLIRTELGDVEVQLEPERAPLTTANFLKYVDSGFYNGGSFYRTVTMRNQPDNRIKIEVVQGGNVPREKEDLPPVPLERTSTTGLTHLDGAISMARGGPDTATSEFFICIGDQPALDFGGKRNPDGQGFAAFGRVVRGMEVMRKIHSSTAQGQALRPEVRIISIVRVK